MELQTKLAPVTLFLFKPYKCLVAEVAAKSVDNVTTGINFNVWKRSHDV